MNKIVNIFRKDGKIEDMMEFYEMLHDCLDKTKNKETMILGGDFSARLGNRAVPG
jgi:hypothetical protein